MPRKTNGMLTPSTQKNSKNSDGPMNFFENTLKSIGLILSEDEPLLTLTQEQALVVRDLEALFDVPSKAVKVKDFIRGLKLYCQDEDCFKKALLPTKLKKPDCALQSQQESMIRLLIRVNCLQTEVLNLILDEITKDATEEREDTTWLRLLLNCLRYLPQIKDPQSLTTKLLDILEVSNFPSQLELLDSLPDIIPDCQYRQVAEQLSKLLDDNDDLSAAIIDCLNTLNLEADIRAQVQDRILLTILTGTSLKVFPVLLEFLMMDTKSPNLTKTFLKIRNALDSVMLSTDGDKDSTKILIFNRLQTYVRTSKVISDAWLNMIIGIKAHGDHKPVDLLILFMLHSTLKSKKIVEGLIRKRISSGLFKISLLERVFDKFIPQQILKDYFPSIVDIGCNLLRSTQDPSVREFSIALFKLLFNHKYTEIIYRKELLDSLILLTGIGNTATVGVVLKLIDYFLDDFAKLQHHTVLLMHLLEKLDTFELKDVKQVFEILCALTCGERADDSMSGLKDEIHIVIRKQLSSSKRIVKHRGIISAVVMAKHLAITSEEQSETSISEDSLITIANLPCGNARDAACLLEFACTSCQACPELMGLYYDQLASMLMTTQYLNKHFMCWLYETMTDNFQNIYVTETVPEPINDLKFSMQYELNSKEELTTPLGVNIGGLTLNQDNSDKNYILLLAPHFRLLRLLHYRQQNGDLSTIDALLGCAVILPTVNDVEDLDSDQAKQMADCLFHCANWFREVISGFVTQDDKKLRFKVVKRLENLIKIEALLNSCLINVPNHRLPVCYFDSLSQVCKQNSPHKEAKSGNPRKKLKSSETVVDANETIASTSAVVATQKKTVAKKTTTNDPHVIFREVDTDLIKLLKYPLIINEENVETSQGITIDIHQLKFILKDFVGKLSILTKDKQTGLSHLNIVSPINMITDCVHILPKIEKHLTVIVSEINRLLEETDGRHDLPLLYSEKAQELKTCFGLIIESYCLIFSWSGFQNSKNIDLLRKILKSSGSQQSQSLNSANRLIIEFIKKLAQYCEQCLDINHGVHLVQTMNALYSTTVPSADIKKIIVCTSAKLLGKRWYNSKGCLHAGKSCNASIDVLVKIYLNGANLKTICGIVGTLQEQAPLLKAKDDCLHMLASIDKQNFHIFYLGVCSALYNRVKTEVQSLTNDEHLTLWETTASTMQGLMSIAKAQETKTNLTSFLKKSIAILKIFLSHGIPILEIMLRNRPDEVVAIFKTIQTSTRFLHHLCCYSKLTKDTGLLSYVPKFRLTLETLIYRVKAALVANKCSAAFWMGNLRNRDLQGEDILSQNTVISEDTNLGDNTEELPEDESSDSDVINEEDARSDSEVF